MAARALSLAETAPSPERIDIRMGAASYPFWLGTAWQDELVERLLAHRGSRYLVVADTNVARLFAAQLVERLSRDAPAHLLAHAAGEPRKDLEAVGELMESALALGADRASVVVAVGGGITGNLAGLAAALLFRGLPLVHVPTSLMAMLDSVLSLKQAVNAGVGKNLVGTFYAPVEVLADTALLRTLPRRETISGLCEAVKNALAIRPGMTEMLMESLDPACRYDDATLLTIIVESVRAKAEVTADDGRECREGLVLEYGHTVGHAVEYTAGGGLSHGEAVGIGMIAAAEIAQRLGHLDAATVALHRDLLSRAGARLTIPAGIDVEEVMRRVGFDNKRGYLRDVEGNAAMVLLRGQGAPIWEHDRALIPVSMDLVREVLYDIAADAASERVLSSSSAGADSVRIANG